MRLALWLFACIALAIPALLVAVALGPVTLGILCAAGFGLLVFGIANLFIGIGVGVGRAGSRLGHHR
jgi:hypothetical protein